MTGFEEVLRIAQEQLEAVSRGDIDAAIGRLDERGAILSVAPAPLADDRPIIEEILRLDKILSGAIRERMMSIRDEVLEGRRGQRALNGYAMRPSDRPRVLD